MAVAFKSHVIELLAFLFKRSYHQLGLLQFDAWVVHAVHDEDGFCRFGGVKQGGFGVYDGAVSGFSGVAYEAVPPWQTQFPLRRGGF